MKEMPHSLTKSQIETLARKTHGFVGADLAFLCNEAAMSALRRHISESNNFKKPNSVDKDETSTIRELERDFAKLTVHDKENESFQGQVRIVWEDFEVSRKKIGPSALREVMMTFSYFHHS